MLYTYTFYCDHCGAVIELTPTNINARLLMVCKGQEQVKRSENGQHIVQGNPFHPYTEMRMIGSRPL